MGKKAKPGTKRYRVVALVTISMHTDVEAASEDEAEERAMERGMMGLCHQCAGGESEHEWVTSGGFDGTPDEVTEVMELDE